VTSVMAIIFPFGMALLFILPIHGKDQRERTRLVSHVRFLASQELRGRKAGTPEGEIAARYIAEQFRALGIEALPSAPDYLQKVPWKREGDPTRAILTTSNVYGLVRGCDRELTEEVLVLVAHLDGQGMQQGLGGEIVLPGARDNAFGVTALIAAAKLLAEKPGRRSVLLFASTAEEAGMIGSQYFVDHPPIPINRIRFVLNTDGAGVYEPRIWSIGGLEQTTAHRLVSRIGRRHGLQTEPYPEAFRFLFEKGDSLPFVVKGIPALTISPGFRRVDDRVLRKIHTPEDRVDEEFDTTYLQRFCRAYAALARTFSMQLRLPVARVPSKNSKP